MSRIINFNIFKSKKDLIKKFKQLEKTTIFIPKWLL